MFLEKFVLELPPGVRTICRRRTSSRSTAVRVQPPAINPKPSIFRSRCTSTWYSRPSRWQSVYPGSSACRSDTLGLYVARKPFPRRKSRTVYTRPWHSPRRAIFRCRIRATSRRSRSPISWKSEKSGDPSRNNCVARRSKRGRSRTKSRRCTFRCCPRSIGIPDHRRWRFPRRKRISPARFPSPLHPRCLLPLYDQRREIRTSGLSSRESRSWCCLLSWGRSSRFPRDPAKDIRGERNRGRSRSSCRWRNIAVRVPSTPDRDFREICSRDGNRIRRHRRNDTFFWRDRRSYSPRDQRGERKSGSTICRNSRRRRSRVLFYTCSENVKQF